MMRYIVYSVVSLFCLCGLAQPCSPTCNQNDTVRIGVLDHVLPSDCDTIISVNDYSVHVIKKDSDVIRVGLNLFSQEMKQSVNADILNFIETALFVKSQNINIDGYENIRIAIGTLDDFKTITPATACSVSNNNSHDLQIDWTTSDMAVRVELPVSYQNVKGGSRAEIENEFIAQVKSAKNSHPKAVTANFENLELYKDSLLYIMPGASYQSRDINRNMFYTNDSLPSLVWNELYPLESIANLFLNPQEIGAKVKLNVTFLKHEYGAKEDVTVDINDLLAVCEQDGCTPYWGVEKFQNGILEGALFFYNWSLGYDHVLKVVLNPTDIIAGNGEISARANLYIPANNVKNLFEPYRKKAESERIVYDE